MNKIEIKNHYIKQNEDNSYEVIMDDVILTENYIRRNRVQPDEKIKIVSYHNSIFDLNPKIKIFIENHIIDYLTLSYKKDVMNFIKSLNYFKNENRDKIIEDPITEYINCRKEENWLVKEIKFVKTLEDIKKIDIFYCKEYYENFCDGDRVQSMYVDIYEKCDNCIKLHKMVYKYYYFKAWKDAGECHDYKPIKGNSVLYDEILDYLKSKNLIDITDKNKLQEIKNIFNFYELNMPYYK